LDFLPSPPGVIGEENLEEEMIGSSLQVTDEDVAEGLVSRAEDTVVVIIPDAKPGNQDLQGGRIVSRNCSVLLQRLDVDFEGRRKLWEKDYENGFQQIEPEEGNEEVGLDNYEAENGAMGDVDLMEDAADDENYVEQDDIVEREHESEESSINVHQQEEGNEFVPLVKYHVIPVYLLLSVSLLKLIVFFFCKYSRTTVYLIAPVCLIQK